MRGPIEAVVPWRVTVRGREAFRAIKCAVPLKQIFASVRRTLHANLPRYQMRGPIEALKSSNANYARKLSFRAIKCAVPLKQNQHMLEFFRRIKPSALSNARSH